MKRLPLFVVAAALAVSIYGTFSATNGMVFFFRGLFTIVLLFVFLVMALDKQKTRDEQ